MIVMKFNGGVRGGKATSDQILVVIWITIRPC